VSEAKVSSALKKGLLAAGCYVWKTNDARTVGVPDIVGCTGLGRHIVAETKFVKAWPKRPSASLLVGHKITYAQAKHLTEVASRRALAFVAIGCPGDRGVDCYIIPWEKWARLGTNGWGENVPSDLARAELLIPAHRCAGSMSSTFSPPAALVG
jgi:hypothetical protein